MQQNKGCYDFEIKWEEKPNMKMHRASMYSMFIYFFMQFLKKIFNESQCYFVISRAIDEGKSE